MKAIFKGYIDVDMNAVFSIEVKNKYGIIFAKKTLELKDSVCADQFVIGNEYDVSDLTK